MKRIVIALLILILVVGTGVVRAEEEYEEEDYVQSRIVGMYVIDCVVTYSHTALNPRGFSFNIDALYNKYTMDESCPYVCDPSFLIDVFNADDLSKKTTLFYASEHCCDLEIGESDEIAETNIQLKEIKTDMAIGSYFYVGYAFNGTGVCSDNLRFTFLTEEEIKSGQYQPTDPRYSLVVRPDIEFDIHPSDQAVSTSWLDYESCEWISFLDDEKYIPDMSIPRLVQFELPVWWEESEGIDVYLMARFYNNDGGDTWIDFDAQFWNYFGNVDYVTDSGSLTWETLVTVGHTDIIDQIVPSGVKQQEADYSYYFVFYNKALNSTMRSAPFLPKEYDYQVVYVVEE